MKITNLLRKLLLPWALCTALAPVHAAADWPAWDVFAKRFVQADGRVVDITFERKSTSEGQSYALFLALVANRRAQFDTLLKWTSDNLAAGQLGEQLPGWLWGQKADGSWGLKDPNSASDADLWIAYTLLEAARLWDEPAYTRTALRLLALVRQHEVVQAGAAGTLLLPGRYGFVLDRQRWRINPSYLPGFLLRRLAGADPQGPWQAIWNGYLVLAPQIFAAGVAPDNVVVDASGRVLPDTEGTPSASYDGIRVYLWAGMSGADSAPLLKRLAAYAALTRRLGVPPEKVDPATGKAVPSSYSPIGYSGALLPYLSALGDDTTLAQQRDRVRADRSGNTNYYDQVLILFGSGWLEGRYRFDELGRLQPQWRH